MIITIIGARPQFVKAAVVCKALDKNMIMHQVIHTGQHYDENMSDVFWDELGLPECTLNLAVGSGTQGAQTARMIEKLEAYLMSILDEVTAVLIYGDTNSTLATSIVASKLNIPIIHVESGLRSFNREMPEEINRIVTDHLSSVLFCSSNDAVVQLGKEGVTKNVYNVGDVMYDAVVSFSEEAKRKFRVSDIIPEVKNNYSLLTLHRPSNTENTENLRSIFKALELINTPVLWPVHPRLRDKLATYHLNKNIIIIEPLSYFQMMVILSSCSKVFTDSGGLQKEAYWLKKPCITLREETEWTETLHHNWNIICGSDVQKITNAYYTEINSASWIPLYGNGDASNKIVDILMKYFKI